MPVSMLRSVMQNVKKDIQVLPTRLLNLVPTGLILTTTSISTFAFDVQEGTNNFTVNWGDGTLTRHTSNARISKNYTVTDIYVVTIDGVFTGFNNASIVAPIASITSWGLTRFSSAASAFLNSLLTDFPITSLDNFVLVTSFANAWRNCTELTSFPLINTAAGTNFFRAWLGCSGLISFPLLNTAAGTNFNSAWNNCSGLTSFPLLNTAAGTSFFQTWNNCSGLTSFPLLNTAAGTSFFQAWLGCSGLISFPANMFDTCLATNYTNAWLGCTNLVQTAVDNIVISINTANRSNGTLEVDGSTPSAAGRAAVDALRARGWTVTVNGY